MLITEFKVVLCVVIVGLLGSVKHDDDWNRNRNSDTLPHLRLDTGLLGGAQNKVGKVWRIRIFLKFK